MLIIQAPITHTERMRTFTWNANCTSTHHRDIKLVTKSNITCSRWETLQQTHKKLFKEGRKEGRIEFRGLGLESSSYGSSFVFHKYSATFPRGESFDDHILNEVDAFLEKLRLEHIGNIEVADALPHVTHNVETIVRSQ
jgi:hypothetical protein